MHNLVAHGAHQTLLRFPSLKEISSYATHETGLFPPAYTLIIAVLRTIARWIRNGLALIGLVYLIVTFTPVLHWWAAALATEWDDPRGEVLVVLGAETHDDVIGESSYWRSVYAVRCWREGWAKTVVITGGTSLVAVSERMKQFLVAGGVPEAAIQTERRAASTRENALFSKPLLDTLPGRKVLLTSDYHMFRAARTFRKAGIEVLPRPFPDALKRQNHWEQRWSVAQILLFETAKIAAYWWKGWI